MPRFTARREQAELITPVPPMNRTFMLNVSFCLLVVAVANLWFLACSSAETAGWAAFGRRG